MHFPRDRALTQCPAGSCPASSASPPWDSRTRGSAAAGPGVEQLLATCAIRKAAGGTEGQELARSVFTHFSQSSEWYHWILQVQKYLRVETGLLGYSVLLRMLFWARGLHLRTSARGEQSKIQWTSSKQQHPHFSCI